MHKPISSNTARAIHVTINAQYGALECERTWYPMIFQALWNQSLVIRFLKQLGKKFFLTGLILWDTKISNAFRYYLQVTLEQSSKRNLQIYPQVTKLESNFQKCYFGSSQVFWDGHSQWMGSFILII